jgi:hypothetical protein
MAGIARSRRMVSPMFLRAYRTFPVPFATLPVPLLRSKIALPVKVFSSRRSLLPSFCVARLPPRWLPLPQ